AVGWTGGVLKLAGERLIEFFAALNVLSEVGLGGYVNLAAGNVTFRQRLRCFLTAEEQHQVKGGIDIVGVGQNAHALATDEGGVLASWTRRERRNRPLPFKFRIGQVHAPCRPLTVDDQITLGGGKGGCRANLFCREAIF